MKRLAYFHIKVSIVDMDLIEYRGYIPGVNPKVRLIIVSANISGKTFSEYA